MVNAENGYVASPVRPTQFTGTQGIRKDQVVWLLGGSPYSCTAATDMTSMPRTNLTGTCGNVVLKTKANPLYVGKALIIICHFTSFRPLLDIRPRLIITLASFFFLMIRPPPASPLFPYPSFLP